MKYHDRINNLERKEVKLENIMIGGNYLVQLGVINILVSVEVAFYRTYRKLEVAFHRCIKSLTL